MSENTYTSGRKSQNRPLADLPDIDWARLAAFIDGEGCIRTVSQKRRGRDYMFPEISISNQDPRLIAWCRERFGGYVSHQGPPARNVKRRHRIFRWYASCSVAHEIFLGCLPYFVIKRNQAEMAITFRDLTMCRPESGKKKWGVYGMPDELKQIQYSLKKQLQDSHTLHFEESIN